MRSEQRQPSWVFHAEIGLDQHDKMLGGCRPDLAPAQGLGRRAQLLQVRQQVVLARRPEHVAVWRQDARLTRDCAARGRVVAC